MLVYVYIFTSINLVSRPGKSSTSRPGHAPWLLIVRRGWPTSRAGALPPSPFGWVHAEALPPKGGKVPALGEPSGIAVAILGLLALGIDLRAQLPRAIEVKSEVMKGGRP
jgi:hypothetical protein